MKSTLLLILFTFFPIDVFGADVKVSVMVGESVTLHTDKIIWRENVIEWYFGQKPIAMINDGSTGFTTSDEKLKDRLQLDRQTGDLMIRNINTTDSGDYKFEITTTTGSSEKTFSVKVLPAGSVTEVTVIKVTVMEGDSVTLQPDPTGIQRYVVTQWQFQHQMLYNQTGSLTIKNIGTNQSGLYEAEISSTSGNYTVHYTQSFSVTVSDAVKTVPVEEGDSVTLHIAEIQNDDLILWMIGNTVIAEILKAAQRFYISAGLDIRFRRRLKLDPQTGSLTITDTRTTDSGLYELKINSSRCSINRRFTVTVTVVTDTVKTVSVKEGDSVTLHTDTEIQNDDLIQWMFGDTVIAEINKADPQPYISDGPDGRFRDRLNLDHQTGSLTITNTRTTESGDYKLKISSSRHTINRRFTVTVTGSDHKSDSGLSPGAKTGIVVGVVLLVAAAAVVIYSLHKISKQGSHGQENGQNRQKQDRDDSANEEIEMAKGPLNGEQQ